MKKYKSMNKKVSRTMCLGLSAALVLGSMGCGKAEAEKASVINNDNQEVVLDEVLNAQVSPSHSSSAGKEEVVYVLADAGGGVKQIIVSDWLKNSSGESSLADRTNLVDIQNVKGYETYEIDKEGNVIWQSEGADIYYRGTSNKEVPVEVKVSYKLDGNDISPEELAGKSGRVTIRMDYENKETRTVVIGGKEQEIKVPFAMISGMVLPQDTFSNIEVTNARLLSEGDNSVVVGVAFPGLKESIDADSLKDKISDEEKKEAIEDLEIPDYIEVSADTESFELEMTMTVAMSDILSDIELTDAIDLSSMTDSMDELENAAEELKDGTRELKDGSGQLKDGTEELLEGAGELWQGAVELKDGTQELYDKSELLDDGAAALYDGTVELQNGCVQLTSGTNELQAGSQRLADGTGSLVNGAKSLNDGALAMQAGVGQVVDQLNVLKAGIGTPVESVTQTPETLLQVSWLLNYSLQQASTADGMAEATYKGILASLQQQKAQVQEELNHAETNLSVAQNAAQQALYELDAACQVNTTEVEVVKERTIETEQKDIPIEAYVYTYETTTTITEKETVNPEDDSRSVEVVSETTEENSSESKIPDTVQVDVDKEVVSTDTMQVQSVDVENLQQKVDAYQTALEEVAACQADVAAYTMQMAALDDSLSEIETYAGNQDALAAKWGPAITYAAILDQKLKEISFNLNNQETNAKISTLVQGAGAMAAGTKSALDGASELNSGANELKSGIESLNSGAAILAAGAGSLKDGAGSLKDGTGQLIEGTGSLNDGAGTLKDGVGTLKDGVLTLDEGMGTLDDGVLELVDGMFRFDEEGISKLTDLFGDDVQDVIERLKAVADSGKDYNTFTELPRGVDGSVKFIIKTDAIKE